MLALNAGISVGGDFVTGDLDAHLRLIDLNVRGVVHLAKVVTSDMASRGSGRVLFTSSIVAAMPGPTATSIFARAGQLDTRLGASDHKADPDAVKAQFNRFVTRPGSAR